MKSFLTSLTTLRNFTLFVMGFSLFGLVLIYNASVAESLATFGHPWHYAERQGIWLVIGCLAYWLVSYVPPGWWKQLAPFLFFGAVGLLIMVLIPGLGEDVLGAQRRIAVGPIRIQPSELTKLALIVFFAQWLERHQRFAPFLFFTGLVFGLILLQPNLSTGFIVVALATLMYFFAGGEIKPLVIFGIIGSFLLAILILSAPYRRERLSTFLNPASDPLGRSYHIRQITIALGRGGLLGQGIGFSKQKQQYIPEVSTDSIFAIHAEETGFVGSVGLIGTYLLLIMAGYEVALRQKDLFRALVAAGVTSWIALHTLLNVAAMVALVPLTGIPLPLVSYGGSAYVSIMLGLGMLAGIIRYQEESSQGKAHPKRVVAPRSGSRRHVAPTMGKR